METSFGITIQATPMPSFVKYIIKFFEFFNHVIMTSQITCFFYINPSVFDRIIDPQDVIYNYIWQIILKDNALTFQKLARNLILCWCIIMQ